MIGEPFSLGDRLFRTTRKLNAMEQAHLSRRISPIIPKLLPLLVLKDKEHLDIKTLGGAFGPLAEVLSEMPDETFNYIVGMCLQVVQVDQDGKLWAAVWNVPSKTLLFQDIDLPTMLQLIGRVIQENLGNFMRGLSPRTSTGQPTTVQTP